MRLKSLFTAGERATYRIAQEIAGCHGVEVLAKVRIADAIEIANSGISNQEYSYALKAHFDVLIVQNDLALLAIEFDGSGHDSANDHLKNALCDRFGLPLVRVGTRHINYKNFEDTAVHFLIYQLFCVDEFLELYGHDPYEPYDPSFFTWVPGRDRAFPFAYAGRWRGRLARHFQEHSHLFGNEVRDSYSHGLIQFGAIEGAWIRGDEIRAICGQSLGRDRYLVGSAQLAFQLFGMHDPRRREHFLRLWTFVIGLAAGDMYNKGLALLESNETGVVSSDQLRKTLAAWTSEGYQLRLGLNVF